MSLNLDPIRSQLLYSTGVDTSGAQEGLNNLNALVSQTNRAMINNTRQAVSFVNTMVVATGHAVNQMFAIMAEAVIQTIELTLAINAAMASATSVTGLGVFRLVVQGVSVAALWVTLMNILEGKQEAAQKTQALSLGLRMIAFRGIILSPQLVIKIILIVQVII